MFSFRLFKILFLLIFFSFLFFSCEYSEPCIKRNTKERTININHLNVNNVVGWEIVPGGLHKITFHFGIRDFGDLGVHNYRIEDVCASIPFYAKVSYRSNLKAEYWFKLRVRELKILVWYPSVPPSQKIIKSIGNRDKGETIQIRLPSATKEFHNPTWVELGFELLFASEQGYGFSEDLALIQEEVENFHFNPDYVEF